jgi:hypothetical protein
MSVLDARLSCNDHKRARSRDVLRGRGFPPPAGTEALWEHIESGEDLAEVAEAFDLDIADVRRALAYETSARAA